MPRAGAFTVLVIGIILSTKQCAEVSAAYEADDEDEKEIYSR